MDTKGHEKFKIAVAQPSSSFLVLLLVLDSGK